MMNFNQTLFSACVIAGMYGPASPPAKSYGPNLKEAVSTQQCKLIGYPGELSPLTWLLAPSSTIEVPNCITDSPI